MALDLLWRYKEVEYKRTEPIDSVLHLIHDFPSVDDEYEECLNRGEMYAFAKSLRLFGLTNEENARNILKWNNPDTCKVGYKGFISDVWSFAEDVFGFQYLFTRNGVEQLNIETGELNPLCKTFNEWIKLVLERTNFYTGYPVAKKWEEVHPEEPLTGQHHLSPIVLFVCQGNYEIDNFFLVGAEENIKLKADIAQQLKDLPDGSRIKFKFQ